MIRDRAPFTQEAVDDMHYQAILDAVAIAELHPEAKGFLILDLDDVVADTRESTIHIFNRFLRRYRPDIQRPTVEEARMGIKDAYAPLLGDEYYKCLWKAIESKEHHFRKAPLVDKELPKRLQELAQAGIFPILALTARNAEQTEVSREYLQRHGLDIPVYADYPENDQVSAMKIDVLLQLAERLPGQKLFMVDDNAYLILQLEERNYPDIFGVKYETPRFAGKVTRRSAIWSTLVGVIMQHVAM